MTALQYMSIGVLLGVISGILLLAFVVGTVMRKQKVPKYARRIRKVQIPDQFYSRFQEEYQRSENIEITLQLMQEQYPKGKLARRITAARDYLTHSRYKDYETALYRYLADNDTKNILSGILLADMQKMKRLPLREAERIQNEKK